MSDAIKKVVIDISAKKDSSVEGATSDLSEQLELLNKGLMTLNETSSESAQDMRMEFMQLSGYIEGLARPIEALGAKLDASVGRQTKQLHGDFLDLSAVAYEGLGKVGDSLDVIAAKLQNVSTQAVGAGRALGSARPSGGGLLGLDEGGDDTLGIFGGRALAGQQYGEPIGPERGPAQYSEPIGPVNLKPLNDPVEATSKWHDFQETISGSVVQLGLMSYALADVGKKTIEDAAMFETAGARLKTFEGALSGGADATATRGLAISGKVFVDTRGLEDAKVKLAEFSDFSEDNFRRVTEAAEATGKPVSDIAAGFGRVEEMGANALRVLRQIGVTQQDLIRAGAEVKSGKIFADPSDIQSMEKFRVALEKVFDAKFGHAAGELADTVGAKLTILKNHATEVSAELGEQLAPSFAKLVEVMAAALKSFEALPDGAKSLVAWGGVAITTVAGLTTVAAALGPVLSVVGPALAAVGNTILSVLLGPLGGVAILVTAATAAMVPAVIACINYEHAQRETQKSIEDNAQALQSAANDWRKYRDAVQDAGGALAGFRDSNVLGSSLQSLFKSTKGMSLTQAQGLMSGLGIANQTDLQTEIAQKTKDRQAAFDKGDLVTAGNLTKQTALLNEINTALEKSLTDTNDLTTANKNLDAATEWEHKVKGIRDYNVEIANQREMLDNLSGALAQHGIDVNSDASVQGYYMGGKRDDDTDKLLADYSDRSAKLQQTQKDQTNDTKQAAQERVQTLKDAFQAESDLRDVSLKERLAENAKEQDAAEGDAKLQQSIAHERNVMLKQARDQGLRDQITDFEASIKIEKDNAKQRLDVGTDTARDYAAALHKIDAQEKAFIGGQKGLSKTELGKGLLRSLNENEAGTGTEAAAADKTADTQARTAALKALQADLKSIETRIRTVDKNSLSGTLADLDQEISKVKASTMAQEEKADKIQELEDRKAAAVEQAEQRKQAAQAKTASLEESLAQRYVKDTEKSGNEQDETDALKAKLAMQVQAIQTRTAKELESAKTAEEASTIRQNAALEEAQAYAGIGDEIDQLIAKQEKAAHASQISGPMSGAQGVDFLNKANTANWFGKNNGGLEEFSLSSGVGPAPGSGPLADLKNSLQQPVTNFGSSVAKFGDYVSKLGPMGGDVQKAGLGIMASAYAQSDAFNRNGPANSPGWSNTTTNQSKVQNTVTIHVDGTQKAPAASEKQLLRSIGEIAGLTSNNKLMSPGDLDARPWGS